MQVVGMHAVNYSWQPANIPCYQTTVQCMSYRQTLHTNTSMLMYKNVQTAQS